ncbi:MAG: hypothetical protein ACYDDF_12510 [Thermoplasmatota archaeon]
MRFSQRNQGLGPDRGLRNAQDITMVEPFQSRTRRLTAILTSIVPLLLLVAVAGTALATGTLATQSTDNLTGEVKQMTEDWIPIIIMLVFVGLGLSFIMALFHNFHSKPK